MADHPTITMPESYGLKPHAFRGEGNRCDVCFGTYEEHIVAQYTTPGLRRGNIAKGDEDAKTIRGDQGQAESSGEVE